MFWYKLNRVEYFADSQEADVHQKRENVYYSLGNCSDAYIQI